MNKRTKKNGSPTCPESARAVSSLSSYESIPTFLFGAPMPLDFSSNQTPPLYPTSFPTAGTVLGTVVALANVLNQYNWTQVGYLMTGSKEPTESIPTCAYISEQIERGSTYLANITDSYSRQVSDTSVSGLKAALKPFKSRARIIVVCLEVAEHKKNLMLAAIENGMINREYVFLFIQASTSMLRFGDPPFWVEADGKDNLAVKEACKNVMIMDKYTNDTDNALLIKQEIADYIHGWPFYCNNCSSNVNASSFAVALADAFSIYLTILNQTYVRDGVKQLKNGSLISQYLKTNSIDIPTLFGTMFTLTKGIRASRYFLSGLNANGVPTAWALVGSSNLNDSSSFTPYYDKAAQTVWETRGGIQPLSEPICGFENNKCVGSPLFYALIGVGGVMIFVIILISLCVAVFLFQRSQRRQLNALWQIPHILLHKPNDTDFTKSVRSMQSGHSNSTKMSSVIRKNTEHTEFLIYNNELVVARKHPINRSWSTDEEDEFRRMRQLDRQNLNKFIGVAVAAGNVFLLWQYCERGSIIEVMEAHAFRIDGYIMTAMIKDIVEGLFYIHNSPFQQHGTLSAYRCVVGDRFEVKIQYYGLTGLKNQTYRRLDDHSALYVAPEHLQGQQTQIGSQAGDIYSFAITCSVILTMKKAYNIDNIEETEAEIVRNVAKGRFPPTRPELELDPSIEIHDDLIKLVKQCWAEHPSDRPKIQDIRDIMLKKIFVNRNSNLMDWMFSLMESSAAELEQDVQQRTLELISEQKKADVLLYRMMPREAADKLKLGVAVEPEVYNEATVFFSDIVSFTVLASKSSPLQIINFLNDVYTLTDNVIDKFDCYKVETIGDGLHIVSGIPRRNNHEHSQQIALMAIEFQRAVKTLRMDHLPNHPIQIRVGVHSGSAVAGIVGMTAPRFCVFGDTVNLAAKMEASGRAGRIHISVTTKELLQRHYPNQFSIFERGETLIKGIGPMYTHWLALPEEANTFEP
ncbi:Guanylate cyclase [Aphelenchoides besseyi]|nr:Guanylate cyclase [Aphelenchoides besseyi]